MDFISIYSGTYKTCFMYRLFFIEKKDKEENENYFSRAFKLFPSKKTLSGPSFVYDFG